MNLKMQGVYTALITPFTDDGDICTKTLKNLVHIQEKSAVDSVVVLGTTGEPASLRDSERELIISCAVEELKGKVPVMVGCGAPSTRKTIELAKRAVDLGADSIQIILPYLVKPTQEGLYKHFEAICNAIKLPICVYNIPGRTSVNLEVQTLERIAELPNIIGVKECSGNFQQITDIIERICLKKQNFTMVCGDDPVTLPMMAQGAHGVMSVISNIVPKATVQLIRAIQEGNLALAQSLSFSLKPLAQAVSVESNPIPIKYMMRLLHLDSGHVRLPLTEPSTVSKQKIEQAVDACRKLINEEVYATVGAHA